MAGATPPPKISPAPTTRPIAEETRPSGADSVAMGPVMSATLPSEKNDTRNSTPKSDVGFGPSCMKSHSVMAAPRNASTAVSRRPSISEMPGTPNCPTNPPKPSADAMPPMACGLSVFPMTGASVRYVGSNPPSTKMQDIAQKSASMQSTMFLLLSTEPQPAVP